ncbi:MAG: IS66 family transposase [Desulfamplus sp.]|nr:IS66 family transposase [Desulfamplus sp.]
MALLVSEAVESSLTPVSGFAFRLPEDMPLSLQRARKEWWQGQYRQAVIELRKREVELAAARSLHQKALKREEQLQQEVAELTAKLRQREKELFGRGSEQSNARNESNPPASPLKRSRGQQKQNPGPKRRNHSHLEEREEFVDLSTEEQCCSTCGLPFEAFSATEDSEEIEIEVQAYRRKIRRKCYKKSCECPSTPLFITAPTPPKLIPKGKLGISVWVEILLSKYLYHQPTYRFVRQWEAQGLFLSQGTITGGLRRLSPLLLPLYEAFCEQQLTESHWHADETRWMVFETIEGKSSHGWYLWVVHSASVIIFILDPSRAAEVIKTHFGEDARGILSVDRYSAYKAMAKVMEIVLAFCWAHVRRDFLKVAASWPQYETWAFEWVERIGNLYHLNKNRLGFAPDTPDYNAADFSLRKAVQHMEQQFQKQLQQPTLPAVQEAVLNSLKNHWQGLTLFVKYPHIPMDNNQAERDIRGSVIGRKNYFGSGSVWSGTLAAICFSLTQTLLLHQINPHSWFTAYFSACAQAGGKVPPHYRDFLPWNLTDEQKAQWALKPEFQNTS